MSLIDDLKWRYATKRFDTDRKVGADDIRTLKEAVNLSATSFGLQPYRIIVVSDPEVKEQLRSASYNQPQLTESSHVFVFCAMTDMPPAHIDAYIERTAEVQEVPREKLNDFANYMKGAVAGRPEETIEPWNKRQVYIGLLAAPIIYLFSGIAPVAAYTTDFFLHVIPFLVTLELAMMVGTWGIAGYACKASYLAFFPLGLKALWTVLRGQKISFKVTPKARQSGGALHLVRPQIAVIGLTAAGALWGLGALAIGGTGHSTTGVVTNILWGINNCAAMMGMVSAALWQPLDKKDDIP